MTSRDLAEREEAENAKKPGTAVSTARPTTASSRAQTPRLGLSCFGCLRGAAAKPRPQVLTLDAGKAPVAVVTVHQPEDDAEGDADGGQLSFQVELPATTLGDACVLDLKEAIQRADPLGREPEQQLLSVFMPRNAGEDLSDASDEETKGNIEDGRWVTMNDDGTALAAYGIEISQHQLQQAQERGLKGDSQPSVEDGLEESKGHEGDATPVTTNGNPVVTYFDVWLAEHEEDGSDSEDAGDAVSAYE